jgi:3-dehydro-4-phosphotetronate decarboxylase
MSGSGGIPASGASLLARRLTSGRTGNISVREGDVVVMTPTGTRLGTLRPGELARIRLDGTRLDGPPPSKEWPLHMAMYRVRPDAAAEVHLHSTFAVAVSCLAEVNPQDVLPRLTRYYVMRVGQLPLLPCHRPGDAALAPLVQRAAADHHALLLANMGRSWPEPTLPRQRMRLRSWRRRPSFSRCSVANPSATSPRRNGVYIVVVSLRVLPDRISTFEAAIRSNAAASLRDEPGCLRFDVLRDADEPTRYLLYEVYTDHAAFTTGHLRSAHFVEWQRIAAHVLEDGGKAESHYTPLP